jgi:hypothetical protein
MLDGRTFTIGTQVIVSGNILRYENPPVAIILQGAMPPKPYRYEIEPDWRGTIDGHVDKYGGTIYKIISRGGIRRTISAIYVHALRD